MTMAQTKWQTRPLSACGEWVCGGTPSKSVASYWNGHIPWFSAKSLKSFDLNDSDDRITSEAAENGTTLIPKGTVVFVVRGMSLANEFRVGVTTRPAAFNQDLRAIIPTDEVDGRYLAHFLKAREQAILSLTNNASHGTKRLPSELLGALPVPLPPREEQHRIAAVLDKADSIRRKREEGIRLTEELLRSSFLEMFGDPVVNPRGWPFRPLGDYISSMTSGPRGWAKYYATGGARFIRSLDVQMNHIGNESPAFVNPPDNSEASRTRVHEGDVLVTITGSRVGRVAFVPEGFGTAYVSQHVSILRLDGRIHPRFLSMYMASEHGGQRQIRAAQYGQTKPGLNLDQIRAFVIPCPPMEQQRVFGSFWQRLDCISHKRLDSHRESKCMFKSLVHRALRGELRG